ncbi:MAG: L,D-transpeptidase [Rhizobiaceae bacterium]|nr:L,D-transpeptidase [Rhizobiaceae bacterium]
MSVLTRRLDRRAFLGASAVGAASIALGGCTMISSEPPTVFDPKPPTEPGFGDFNAMYAAKVDEGYNLPAIPIAQMDQKYLRQIVKDPTGEKPGTIVVDTSSYFLYLVRSDGKAYRYGVGLGRPGFEWTGSGVIQWKQKWPRWTPPAEMIARDPKLEQYSAENGGMPPGPTNPLGARAHYIFQNGQDTFYRIHGSPEWKSIGTAASSGCVRMINQDVIDLYDRVPSATPIKVVAGLGGSAVAAASMQATSARSPRRATPIDAGVPKDAIRLN